MVNLGFDPPDPHLFSEAVNLSEHHDVSTQKELDCSRGLATALSTIKIAQPMASQWVIVARRSVWQEVLSDATVLWQWEVCGVFVRHVQPFSCH